MYIALHLDVVVALLIGVGLGRVWGWLRRRTTKD